MHVIPAESCSIVTVVGVKKHAVADFDAFLDKSTTRGHQDTTRDIWLIIPVDAAMRRRRTKRLLDALLTGVRQIRFTLGACIRLSEHAGVTKMQSSAKKVFGFTAQWDPESGTWWCSNDALPVSTQAPTFDELVARVSEIAPEIAAINGLADVGDEIEIRVAGEKVQSVPVAATA